MAVRVHELAKEFGVPSKVILSTLSDMGEYVKSASSTVEAPVIRVAGSNIPYPPSRMEEEFLPDLDRILDGVDRALAY